MKFFPQFFMKSFFFRIFLLIFNCAGTQTESLKVKSEGTFLKGAGLQEGPLTSGKIYMKQLSFQCIPMSIVRFSREKHLSGKFIAPTYVQFAICGRSFAG